MTRIGACLKAATSCSPATTGTLQVTTEHLHVCCLPPDTLKKLPLPRWWLLLIKPAGHVLPSPLLGARGSQ